MYNLRKIKREEELSNEVLFFMSKVCRTSEKV